MRKNRIEEVPELGSTERMISALSGSYLLFKALSTRKSGFLKALTGGYLIYRGATGHCPVGNAIGRGQVDEVGDIHLTTSLTVNKPRSEVYEFWRKLDNLPLIMEHLERVTVMDEKISEWEARIPGGVGTITWKSEIVEDEPGVRLGWQSLPDSTIVNIGNVNFHDAGKFGTEVRVVISYRAPFGSAGDNVAKLLNPVFKEMVRNDIMNFKNYMETGQKSSNIKVPVSQRRG